MNQTDFSRNMRILRSVIPTEPWRRIKQAGQSLPMPGHQLLSVSLNPDPIQIIHVTEMIPIVQDWTWWVWQLQLIMGKSCRLAIWSTAEWKLFEKVTSSGFEPKTSVVKVWCSTNELFVQRQGLVFDQAANISLQWSIFCWNGQYFSKMVNISLRQSKIHHMAKIPPKWSKIHHVVKNPPKWWIFRQTVKFSSNGETTWKGPKGLFMCFCQNGEY